MSYSNEFDLLMKKPSSAVLYEPGSARLNMGSISQANTPEQSPKRQGESIRASLDKLAKGGSKEAIARESGSARDKIRSQIESVHEVLHHNEVSSEKGDTALGD